MSTRKKYALRTAAAAALSASFLLLGNTGESSALPAAEAAVSDSIPVQTEVAKPFALVREGKSGALSIPMARSSFRRSTMRSHPMQMAS